MATTKVYLTNTSATTYTIPSDFDVTGPNSVECIGAGGSGVGPSGNVGTGGEGGHYAKSINLSLAVGQVVNIQIGSGGVPISSTVSAKGGDTWFGGSSLASSLCGAVGGKGATNSSSDATTPTTNDVGNSIIYKGGTGGSIGANSQGGSGGGGAAGPGGTGGNGGRDGPLGGSGGGGAGNTGGNGANALDSTTSTATPGGNAGDGTAGGPIGTTGNHGSGGGGGSSGSNAGNGGAGNESTWDATHGPGGGGGGGGNNIGIGGNGGLYGGGGGGGGWLGGSSGNGAQGLIVFTYTVANPNISASISGTSASTAVSGVAAYSGAKTYVLSGSRAGIGSVALQDNISGKTYMIADVGAETDATGALNATLTLTGVQANSAVTAPTAGIVRPPVTVNLPSVFITAQTTSPKIEIDAKLSGVQSTSAVGALTTPTIRTANITGVSATSQIGTLTVTSKTVKPTNVQIKTGVVATAGIGTLKVIKGASVVGVATTSGLGVLSPAITTSISGVVSTDGITIPAIQIGTSLGLPTPGVSAIAAIGNSAIEIDKSIPSEFTTGGIGNLTTATDYDIALSGVNSTALIGPPNVEVDIKLSGVEADSAVGTFAFGRVATITGVSATAGIGIITPSLLTLSGVQANTGIGTVGVQSHNAVIQGVQAIANPGSLLINVQSPQVINVSIDPSASATTAIGQLVPNIMPHALGVETDASVGNVTVAIHQGGLAFTDISVETILSFPDDFNMSLRCSDTSGASWQMPTHHSIGREGQYLTSPQWRRLGMSRRGRVFELYWSCPRSTALQGATITFEESA